MIPLLAAALAFTALAGSSVLQTGLFVAFLVTLYAVYIIHNQEEVLYAPVVNGIRVPEENPVGLRSPPEQQLKFEEIWRVVDGQRVHCTAAVRCIRPRFCACECPSCGCGLRLCQMHQRIKLR